MPKANLWIINHRILEMKSGNEPTISLPVYFKSIKKIKIMFYEKTKTKGPKEKQKKKFLSARVEPRPTVGEGLRVIQWRHDN